MPYVNIFAESSPLNYYFFLLLVYGSVYFYLHWIQALWQQFTQKLEHNSKGEKNGEIERGSGGSCCHLLNTWGQRENRIVYLHICLFFYLDRMRSFGLLPLIC